MHPDIHSLYVRPYEEGPLPTWNWLINQSDGRVVSHEVALHMGIALQDPSPARWTLLVS